VEAGAAACAQITQKVTSVYFWQGAVREEEESLIFLKTVETKVTEVKRLVVAHHSYKVPELVFLPFVDGNEAYFQWMDRVCSRPL
jgi:periplasmic divalent cation tolerance protein